MGRSEISLPPREMTVVETAVVSCGDADEWTQAECVLKATLIRLLKNCLHIKKIMK